MKLARHVTLTETANGHVLLDTRRGTYWHLNQSGYAIVQGLLEGKSLTELSRIVAETGNVDRERAVNDCSAFLAELLRAHLVKGHVK